MCYKYRLYDRIYTFIANDLQKKYYQKQEPKNKSVTFLKSLSVYKQYHCREDYFLKNIKHVHVYR